MEILSTGADHALGVIHGHLLGVWDGAVSITAVRKWSECLRAMVKERPGYTAYLSYERSGFRMPTDEVRKLIVDTLRGVDGELAVCCVVVPGMGFKTAAVRALVSGIAFMAHGKTPLTCVSTLDEAFQWIAPRLPRDDGWPGHRELAEAITELSSKMPTG